MGKCKVTAIILAAGKGKRMNTTVAKQFLTLRDKPVLYYSLKSFERSEVDEIILVTGQDQINYCKDEVVGRFQIGKVSKIVCGGKERSNSVYHALNSIKQTDYILIHDGARPFITVELINHMIQEVKENDACILGTPVKDTIKVVSSDNVIQTTPRRESLWAAQTPQAFSFPALKEAYDRMFRVQSKGEVMATDDSMVYEQYMKCPVKIIPGDYKNIKLTSPEDYIFAQILMDSLLCEKDEKNKQF